MKRKTRTLTVNGRRYAWRYDFDGGAVHRFSPLEDKTARITVRFPHTPQAEPELPAVGTFPEMLLLRRDGTEERIQTLSPKLAALLLSHLAEAFTPRKSVEYDGFTLLAETGSEIVRIQEGNYW